jgi:hypothetical protein
MAITRVAVSEHYLMTWMAIISTKLAGIQIAY